MAVDGCANFSRKQLPDLGALPVHLTAVALHGATLLGLCCGIFESWSVFSDNVLAAGKVTKTSRNSNPFIRQNQYLAPRFQAEGFEDLVVFFFENLTEQMTCFRFFMGKLCKCYFFLNNFPTFGYFLPPRPRLARFHSTALFVLVGFEAVILCLCRCYRASLKRKRYRVSIHVSRLRNQVMENVIEMFSLFESWRVWCSLFKHSNHGMLTAPRIQSGFWAAMGFPVTDPISRRHWYKSPVTHDALSFLSFWSPVLVLPKNNGMLHYPKMAVFQCKISQFVLVDLKMS